MLEYHIALAWLVASISYIVYCLFIKYCNNSNSFPPRVGSGNDSNSINGYNANWMSFIDLKYKNLSWSTIRVHVDPEYETILACEHGYYFENGAEFQNIWEFVDFVRNYQYQTWHPWYPCSCYRHQFGYYCTGAKV